MNEHWLELDFKIQLDKFDLEIAWSANSRVLGLFGPSGSGKTTILETLAGLRKRATGFIRCGNSVWLESSRSIFMRPEQRGIGYVPQDLLLFPHRDVRQNLQASVHRFGRDKRAFRSIFEETVRVLELDSLLHRPVESLSGGERQRVALGRALCSAPKMILLDEPLSSLDTKLRYRILPYLIRIREQFDIPILIVSHNPVELQALCDEVVAIDNGKVVARGQPLEVFAQSRIYAAARGDGFENVLSSIVCTRRDHSSTFVLGADREGQVVHAPRIDAPPGTKVHLGIRSTEIILARQHVTGLSARNCLSGIIQTVEEAGQGVLVTVQLEHTGTAPLVVELTHDALQELNIAPGGSIYVVIKSNSITPYI